MKYILFIQSPNPLENCTFEKDGTLAKRKISKEQEYAYLIGFILVVI